MTEEPRRWLSEVLREELVRLDGDLSPETVSQLDARDRQLQAAVAAASDEENAIEAAYRQADADKLKILYAAIHERRRKEGKVRTALCFSGGGIRSATFALGVMQRLASVGLLTKFDYLSTVSGGGYIGSWLSSFARRSPKGIADVEEGIRGVEPGVRNPLAPEIEPLRWLRRFSNYLTPKLGLMSADTWAFAGSYFRNLVLVWLMFVPFLAALLALPRLGIALLRDQPADGALWMRNAAALLLLLGTVVIAWSRPVSYRKKGWLTNGWFLLLVLFPYVAGSLLLVLYWAADWREPTREDLVYAFSGLIGINVFSSLVYMIRYFLELRRQRPRNVRTDSTVTRYKWKKFVWEMIAAGVAGAAGAGLLYAAVVKLFKDPRAGAVEPLTIATWQDLPPRLAHADAEIYLCFALPVVLGILFVQSVLFVGLSSWFNEEYDREWWGRAAGWVLLAGVAWIAGTAIAIYGPVAIYYAPTFYASLTAGTGLASILIGKSGATGANDREKDEKAGPAQTGANIGLALAGPLFAITLLALISLCTSRILNAIDPPPRLTDRQIALLTAGTYQIRQDAPFEYEDEKPANAPAAPTPAPAPRSAPKVANFETSRFPAIDRTEIAANEHLWAVDRTGVRTGLFLVFGLGFFSLFVSLFIGANQFSMHGLYRNRLIRGYLGASNDDRRENRFSGFAPNDNAQMDRLRPEMFWPSTLMNVTVDGQKIVQALKPAIDPGTEAAVNAAAAAPEDPELRAVAAELLAEALNRIVDGPPLTPPPPGMQVPQSVANRRTLEGQFPEMFRKMDDHLRPLHVVNTTLNLVAGDNLAWQERKGSAFAVTPLYTGNPALGYRATRAYGGPAGISLGTAVAISGAAASPNMGYHSSPALSFLLTLFNVRLGWWLGNPKKATYSDRNPRNTLLTVLSEAFGLTNDTSRYVYLSDGGHFENLALYEMVLRRCHCIVLSDAGADPEFGFDDLGNAIRKIRIDLGIDIVITRMALFPRSKKDPSHPRYAAVAKIRYSQVDPDAEDGLLLYLKPAFYGEKEPKDVYNYASTYPTFPHQSTGDQWFSESQFESYRQLGYFALGQVVDDWKKIGTVCDLITEAEKQFGAPSPPAATMSPRTKYM